MAGKSKDKEKVMPLADEVAPEADHTGNPFGDSVAAGVPEEGGGERPAPQGPLNPADVKSK
jgi:hypothetical protein